VLHAVSAYLLEGTTVAGSKFCASIGAGISSISCNRPVTSCDNSCATVSVTRCSVQQSVHQHSISNTHVISNFVSDSKCLHYSNDATQIRRQDSAQHIVSKHCISNLHRAAVALQYTLIAVL
jgi:hypothetical protein